MTIRKPTEADYHEVESVIRESFWNVYREGAIEHYVLHNMRQDKDFVPELEYVCEENKSIVAAIAYMLSDIKADDGKDKKILLLGPVGVLPKFQAKGYGKKLIEYTLDKAKALNYPCVVLSGNPFYYSQFGFESASNYGIYYKGLDKNEQSPFFMLKVFDEDKIKELRGVYSDPPVYYPDDAAVKEYDKLFCKE